MFDCQHMVDFFNGGINYEYAADHKDACGKVDTPFEDPGPCEDVERFGQCVDQVDHHKQQDHAERHGENNTPKPHGLLMRNRRTLAFDRDVEKIVKAQDRLQKTQHHKRAKVF